MVLSTESSQMTSGCRWLVSSLERLLVWFCQRLIRLYQITLSPFIGNQCRFHPSCSHYAQDALAQRGLIPGIWLTVRRLSRCHPLAEGGFDPVSPQPDPSLTVSSTVPPTLGSRNSA